MANKQYADIAAARHMREQVVKPEKGNGRGQRAETAPRPPKAGRQPQNLKDPGYRKKRFVALILTTLVCLSVPSLIALLVFFG